MVQIRLTVSQLALKLGGRVEGDGRGVVTGVASLASAGPDDVTFMDGANRASQLARTRAGAAIVGPDHPPAEVPLICVDNVMAAVGALLEMLAGPEDLPPAGVHPSAAVSDDASVGDGAAIGPWVVVAGKAQIGPSAVLCPNVTVGAGAVIGEKTVLYPGTVVFSGCRIGRNCRIGPNAVIGSCGFGYYFANGRHNRISHAGTVEIGDDVDIGACSCVDRGKFASTRIGDGTKIDNLVQIAHNVQIGRGCMLAGEVGIAGSVVLKDYVLLGGGVGVRDNVTVGTGVKAAANTMIMRDVCDGKEVAGHPAIDAGRQLRAWEIIKRLPEMREEIRRMKKRLKDLESTKNHPE